MKKLSAYLIVIMLCLSGIPILISENVSAEYSGYEYYWDDEGGSDNLASTASNWYQMFEGTKTDNVVPTVDSHVYINESASAVTWDLTTAIDNLTISTGYTGVFTQTEKMVVNELYINAGSIYFSTTKYVDISGNSYINPTTLNNNYGRINLTQDLTIFIKNARLIELRVYGSVTYTGLAYFFNFFTDNSSVVTITNGARTGFIEWSLTTYGYMDYGTLISDGTGYFTQLYAYNTYHKVWPFNEPLCNYRLANSGSISSYQESFDGDIVARTISILNDYVGASAIFYTNGYKLTAIGLGITFGIRTAIYLNDSKVYCNGNYLASAGTVDYGTSTLILSGVGTGYTITTVSGASLYNLTVNSTSWYGLGSSFTVTSWCCLLGVINPGSYILTAPTPTFYDDIPSSVNEGETYSAIVYGNTTLRYDEWLSFDNATWLTISQNSNGSWSFSGVPQGDSSGTYTCNILLYSAIAYEWYNFTIQVENSIYCYFDSEPITVLDVGSMYLYHPVVVCNGSYYLSISGDGVLVVSNATGNVTGSPIAGVYNIVLWATDSSGNIAYQNYTLTVSPHVNVWDNDATISLFGMVLFYSILTLLNFIGLKLDYGLLQLFALLVMIMALPAIWVSSSLGIMFELMFMLSNIVLIVIGFVGRD